MREDTVYGLINEVKGQIQQIVQFVTNFQQAVRLDSTGKEIRLLGIQRLLLAKGLITEAELTEKSGEVIKEMQAQAEAAQKEVEEKAAAPVIVPATPEQTAKVINTPADAVVIPPQA